MKAIQKACLTGIVLAGLLSANIATAYDGDVDYSAPYVTLDPETGKLITVDPKQQQAAAQPAPQHEGSAADTATTAAAASIDTGANTDESSAEAGANPVLIAVAAIVLVAVVVAATRRKPTPSTEDRTS